MTRSTRRSRTCGTTTSSRGPPSATPSARPGRRPSNGMDERTHHHEHQLLRVQRNAAPQRGPSRHDRGAQLPSRRWADRVDRTRRPHHLRQRRREPGHHAAPARRPGRRRHRRRSRPRPGGGGVMDPWTFGRGNTLAYVIAAVLIIAWPVVLVGLVLGFAWYVLRPTGKAAWKHWPATLVALAFLGLVLVLGPIEAVGAPVGLVLGLALDLVVVRLAFPDLFARYVTAPWGRRRRRLRLVKTWA